MFRVITQNLKKNYVSTMNPCKLYDRSNFHLDFHVRSNCYLVGLVITYSFVVPTFYKKISGHQSLILEH